MGAWKKIFITVIVLVMMIFILANTALNYQKTSETGRPYRVEINRAAFQIEKNGYKNIDLSQYEYVSQVTKYKDNFYNTGSDYAIREINGQLYRFDYSTKNSSGHVQFIILLNITLAAMTAVIAGILFYIRAKIILPFEHLMDVPYELSKGNLTVPVKENKNHFFGKFLWGIDLLRENIEQQKQRELKLQKEKKTLLLALSHDIKTPLSAIKLYSKALSRNLYQDAEKQQELAESINKKADEIEGYVSQIISASREDFLSLDVKNGEFYLSDLIQEIKTYYSEKLALVKTEFIIGTYRNCLLFGDLDRSIEVLQNIIENAIKYGDGRRVELLFPTEEEGVLIAVRNSGCTLDKAQLPHIFESFWRGANSENIHGSGLGLYICRQLMHKMNGEIFAETDSKLDENFITVTAVFGKPT